MPERYSKERKQKNMNIHKAMLRNPAGRASNRHAAEQMRVSEQKQLPNYDMLENQGGSRLAVEGISSELSAKYDVDKTIPEPKNAKPAPKEENTNTIGLRSNRRIID